MALLLNAGDTVSRSYSYTQPSPLHPSQPQGTGERTGNLYNVPDESATTNNLVTLVDLGADTTVNTITVSCMFDNLLATGSYSAFLDFLKDDGTHQYVTLSNIYNVADDTPVIANTITTGNYYVTKNNITFRYIKAYLYSTAYNKFQSGTIKWAFYDSEKKDYEPYGYKIPISSANTTTPVYLGEVQTTRKVRKYECTGQEAWDVNPASNVFFVAINNALGTANVITSVCSHYQAVENKSLYNQVPNNCSCIRANASVLWIKDTNYDSSSYYSAIEDWKAYLAQQYANGTPVTVWYVLATPETAVVNEPLMRIGGYADEVSNITIPVTAGGDTLSVDTTVQPSEVTVNYKGWHPVTDVHERDSGQWD